MRHDDLIQLQLLALIGISQIAWTIMINFLMTEKSCIGFQRTWNFKSGAVVNEV